MWYTRAVLCLLGASLAISRGEAADRPPAYSWCELSRAGCPHHIAPWAICGQSPRDVGYYVGGGAVCRGEGRCLEEGVWGHDYQKFPGKLPWIALGWHHGRKVQGGTGAYQSNGLSNR